jgi:acetyl esterase/lipase
MVAFLGLALLRGATPSGAAPGVEVRRDVVYGTAGGKPLLLDAYVPPGPASDRPAVLLVHGGGFRVGDKASFAPEATRLAERGWVAFSVNYRLDEVSAFPAEADDVQAAVRWVRAHADGYGADASRIGALGESAGGSLTALLATLGEGPLDTGARVKAGVAWSGPMDHTELARERGDDWAMQVMGCTLAACGERFDQASPVTHVDRSDAPLLLFNSTDELVPLRQARAMDARLGRAGVDHELRVLPGDRHALDYRDEAWPATVAFLDRYLRRGRASSSPRTAAVVTAAVLAAGLAAGAFATRRRA